MPTSRQRWGGRLPGAVANAVLEIMENSQIEVSYGEKKPLQKQRQVDDSECSCCNGNEPAKILNIHCHAFWNDLMWEKKTALCRITSLKHSHVAIVRYWRFEMFIFAQIRNGNLPTSVEKKIPGVSYMCCSVHAMYKNIFVIEFLFLLLLMRRILPEQHWGFAFNWHLEWNLRLLWAILSDPDHRSDI